MIDIQKIKIGDRVFAIIDEPIYEPDDFYYGIYLPTRIKSFCVAKKDISDNGLWILSKLGAYYNTDYLFYTKDDALVELHKRLKIYWQEYKCDEMIKKLLSIRRKIKRIK